MKKRQLIETDVTIVENSNDGFGYGFIPYPEGKQSRVEVPFTLVGDKVRVTLLGKYKGTYSSRIEEIIEPSPKRIAPRCIHFGTCGGCRWQNISYVNELKQKEAFISKCLAPYMTEKTTVYPIISCSPAWNYRNKVELSFSSDKAKNHYLGFMMLGGRRRVFNMQECHLVNPWVVQGVEAVRDWWEQSEIEAYHPTHNSGSLRTLTFREGRRTGDRLVMLTVSGNPDYSLHKSQLNSFVQSLKDKIEPDQPDAKLSIFLRIQQIAKGKKTNFYEIVLYGPDHIRETLYINPHKDQTSPEKLYFNISPSAFFQPNTEQAERLYSSALQLANLSEGSLVYDLYCGTGTLGICAAKEAKEVIGIELVDESVVDARENIKLNHLDNIKIYLGDVGTVLDQLSNLKKPDCIFVDPPRVGLDTKTIHHLLELHPKTLVYISCNPITQAANLDLFLKNGYKLEAVQPVDQFPHTAHVENITVLTRGFKCKSIYF